MAAPKQLSPEVLAQLQALYAGQNPSGYNPNYNTRQKIDAGNGSSYWTTFDEANGGEAGSGAQYTPTNHYLWDDKALESGNQQTPGYRYNVDGSYDGEARLHSVKSGQLLAMAALAAAGMGALGAGVGAGAAGSGGAGGFIGEGALSGVGAWDAALAGALPAKASTTMLASAPFAESAAGSGMTVPTISQAAQSAAGLESSLAPYLTSFGPAAAGSGILEALGGTKGLLGIGTTLAGALAGSKGGSGSGNQDVTKRMDPRLDEYIYGDGGLFPRAKGLLAEQMSPERMAQWDKMRNVGMGLLGQTPAGNGFDQMYKRR